MQLIKQAVKAGEHDFKPNKLHHTSQRVIRGEFVFDSSMWFSWKDWEHYPYDGLNKIGLGLTLSLTFNDNRSGMFAYFPDKKVPGRFDVYAYRNDRKGRHDFWHLANISHGERYETFFSWIGGKATWRLRRKGASEWQADITQDLKSPGLLLRFFGMIIGGVYRVLGGYFGGRYPSPKDSFFESGYTL